MHLNFGFIFQGLATGCKELNLRTQQRYASARSQIRRRREKSTLILVSIVLIFMVCHMFRLSLQVSLLRRSDQSGNGRVQLFFI